MAFAAAGRGFGLRPLCALRLALLEEAARQEVVGSPLQDGLELGLGGLEVAAVEQRAAERHAGRGVERMLLEALAADADGLFELALLAQLLGQLREEPGSRVLLETAPKLLDP